MRRSWLVADSSLGTSRRIGRGNASRADFGEVTLVPGSMDLVGDRVIVVGVDTQLAVLAPAPRPNRTIVPERQTMVFAGRHLDNTSEVAHAIGPMDLVRYRVVVVGLDTAREKKAPVIIIDYLRKLRTDRHIRDERLRVDEILCRLKAIATKYNTPVLAVSELARDSYKSGQRLSMASFKESGSIEYDASWLGILAAVEEDETGEFNLVNNWERIIETTGNVDLIVLKAKRGTGLRGRVPLKAGRDHMIVRDREVKAPNDKKRQGKISGSVIIAGTGTIPYMHWIMKSFQLSLQRSLIAVNES